MKPKLTDRMNSLIGGSPSLGVKKVTSAVAKPMPSVSKVAKAIPRVSATVAPKMSRLATTKMKPQLIRKKF